MNKHRWTEVWNRERDKDRRKGRKREKTRTRNDVISQRCHVCHMPRPPGIKIPNFMWHTHTHWQKFACRTIVNWPSPKATCSCNFICLFRIHTRTYTHQHISIYTFACVHVRSHIARYIYISRTYSEWQLKDSCISTVWVITCIVCRERKWQGDKLM